MPDDQGHIHRAVHIYGDFQKKIQIRHVIHDGGNQDAGVVGRGEIEPTIENATLEELEVAMKCAPSHQSSLRMRAIWTLGRGFGKTEVIDFPGVDYSALTDWIPHFVDRGIYGLIEKKKARHRFKADYFSDFFARELEKHLARIVYALNSFFKTPDS